MVLATRIDLPAPTRAVGGLLSAARPLPTGWERGITFGSTSCVGPQPWPYCITDPEDEKTGNSPEDVVEFEPVGIVQGVECTTLSTDAARQDAIDNLEATADWQLGRELANGDVTGNPNLLEATPVVAGGAGWSEALAAAEQAAANGLFGRLAFIHVSWYGLTMLVGNQLVVRDGRSWRTPVGNVVVASAGYPFGDEIYATGEVFASVSTPDSRVDVDRAVNTTTAFAEQIGLAAFAPCFNVVVEVT